MKKTVLTLSLAILLSVTFFTRPTKASFTECPMGVVCTYKDVWDPVVKQWKTDSVQSTQDDSALFIIGIQNTTGSAKTNVLIKDVLPPELSYTTGSLRLFDNNNLCNGNCTETNLFGSGISISTLPKDTALQMWFYTTVDQNLTPGTHTLTNNAYFTWDGGSDHNDASVIVTATPPASGKVLINEINHAPKADWSADNDYTLSGRTDITVDDEFIEFYVKEAGIDLTNANWELVIGGVSTQLINAGAGYQYISTTGGTVNNTKVGDYLLINNPLTNITDSATIDIRYLNTSMDSVTLPGSTPTNLLDETYGRGATSDNTFSRNHGTPGRANTKRIANVYEAEIYTDSSTGNAHGVDVNDGAASEGRAVVASPGHDLDGNMYQITTSDHNAAGAYQATIRLKTLGANLNDGLNKFADFVVNYDGKETGFAIVGRDMTANNTYKEFTIDFVKPATTGNNTYSVGFFNGGNAQVVVDYISVKPDTASTVVPMVIQSEDLHLKAGYIYNDAGTVVVLGPKSEATSPTHIAYGPYTSAMISTLNAKQYKATFRMKFENITGNANDIVARVDVYNPHEGISREALIRVGNVTSGGYANYELIFPSASEGTFQFRIVNWGNADIYFDSILVQEISNQSSWRYEAENDFSYPNGATIVNNAGASNGQEVISTVASQNTGFVVQGPYTLDQTATSDEYKATFRMRTDVPSTSSNNGAMLIVRNFDTAEVIANSYIPANMLSTTYEDFSLYFPALTHGIIDFEVVFLDEVNVILDYVQVDKVTTSTLPRHIEAEYLYSPNGTGEVISSGGATVVRGRDGIDDQSVLVYSNSQETFVPGNYNATYLVQKVNSNNSNNFIAYVEVWDDNGNNLAFYEVRENELITSGTTPFDLPFTLTTPSKIYYKVFFVGGLSNSVEIDKIILNTI